MKITEVKITGFKSFVDGVHLPIEQGLTGIVGPNGCGKSNILEAMRWVMGATSAKALRGADMDDVIFAGTDNRPPRDIAEVIIKIDNTQHLSPEPFKYTPHLEISRKIKRNSGSTFKINGKEVRAKDIQLMFADASSGANSPALVRQGQISELINARPENRRKVLEEAAGISGLQARRHEAQNKLNATEANLERIGEIIIHMEEQISSLKKQAVRAQKYRNLQGQIRGLEMYLILQKLNGFKTSLEEVTTSLKIATNQNTDAQIALNRANRALEETEEGLKPLLEEQALADAILRQIENRAQDFAREEEALAEKIENSNNQITKLNRDIARENEIIEDAKNSLLAIENELSQIQIIENHDEEIAGFEKKEGEFIKSIEDLNLKLNQIIANNAQYRAQFDEKQRQFNNANRQIENLKSQISAKSQSLDENIKNLEADNRLKLAQDELEKLETAFEEFNSEIANLDAEFKNLETQEDEARKKSQNAQNQYSSLKSELNGLLALNKNNPQSSNSALSQIKVQKGFEKALSAALGDDLNAQIGKSSENHWSLSEVSPNWPNKPQNLLSDVVEAPKELLARLKSIAIIDDDEIDNISMPPFGMRYVTKSGRLLRWDGFVITGNSPMPAAIRLEQINRIKEIESQIPEFEKTANESAQNYAKIRANLNSIRDKLSAKRSKSNDWQKQFAAEQNKISNLQGEFSRANSQLEVLKNQITELKQNLEAQEKEKSELGEIDTNSFEAQIAKFKSEENLIRNQSNELNTQLTEIKSQKIALKHQIEGQIQRRNNAINSRDNWQKRLDASNAHLKNLNQEIEKANIELEQLKTKPKMLEQEKQKSLAELPKIEARKKAADDKLAIAQTAIREAHIDARKKEDAFNATKEAIATAQILLQTWQERISELEAQIWQNHQVAADDLQRLIDAQLGESVKNLNPEKAQARLAKAFEEREDIGGVNLRADIELEEQSTRAQSLSKERDDLLAAVSKLRKAIDEINQEGQERLLKAFDTVNGHFIELFTGLFGGGTAHLALTENEDPLGGGLEVYACPPGKRLSSMSLMSGGEQALTASALIFAVFLSNPAPISVLDELDAPLDDANVDRFCALLDEMRKRTETRFIVITHHPITMARMDRLFGVTMAERGVSHVVSVDLSRAQSMIDATQ